jgi:hypothetical protein
MSLRSRGLLILKKRAKPFLIANADRARRWDPQRARVRRLLRVFGRFKRASFASRGVTTRRSTCAEATHLSPSRDYAACRAATEAAATG